MYTRIALLLVVLYTQHVKLIYSESHFTNTWAVEIKGGPEVAKKVATDHGYEIVRQVSKLLHYSWNCISILFFNNDK